ncbi:DNA-directed RNA polymerase subunit beta [Bacillus sp. HMF5848]|uniref:DNA-directed RNA polymerase subunit beta n=1 Tax=Bacillus sp. HMF5848 TaxID=2495421 RepID=UPI000F7B2183|nr:DNA-directed RNA polymerase subunit beta [Bacillus sp. HMF5848]RSK28892.1 DNA-directed RNA polymerase subunit beta [Bacillus sp. HMF5848]
MASNAENTNLKSRAELRRSRDQEYTEQARPKEEPIKKKKKRIRVRLIPIWMRIIIVLVLMFVSLISGAMFGYGVLGDGEPADALKSSTWQHIVDLVNKE